MTKKMANRSIAAKVTKRSRPAKKVTSAPAKRGKESVNFQDRGAVTGKSLVSQRPIRGGAKLLGAKAGEKLTPSKSKVERGFLAEMKEMLLKKRAELDGRISEKIKEHLLLTSQRSADTTDLASDSLDDELALLVAEAETHERAQIDEALVKVRDGTFGTCEGCGKSIPLARLRVLPFAALCVKCKQLEEELGPSFLHSGEQGEEESEGSEKSEEESSSGG